MCYWLNKNPQQNDKTCQHGLFVDDKGNDYNQSSSQMKRKKKPDAHLSYQARI